MVRARRRLPGSTPRCGWTQPWQVPAKAVGRLVRAVVAELSDESDAIGHVKFLIRDHLYDIKVSHTAADPASS